MRVLWLSHMLPYPPTGGSLLRTYHLLREASRFAQVDLLAFVQRSLLSEGGSPEEAVRAIESFARVRGIFDLPAESRGGKALLAARCVARGRSYTTAWTHSRPFRAATERALRDGYDAVVLDTIGLMRNVPESRGVPVVLNHHNEEVSMLERRGDRAAALRRRYFRFESRRLREECERFFPRVARHLVVSDLDALRLTALHPGVVTDTIPNGVDVDEFGVVVPPAEADPFTLLFIGGGTWYPNRDAVSWLLQEIWPACTARFPNARLVLVGRAPTPESLAAARRDPRVVVTGFVDDIRPWCRQAHAFVCPIRDGGGTRLKVLHALSMGLPLISTGIGMEGIDATPGVHYLLADSAADFADQVARLATDAGERRRLSREGRDLVQRAFAWSSIGARLRESLESAGRGTTGPVAGRG